MTLHHLTTGVLAAILFMAMLNDSRQREAIEHLMEFKNIVINAQLQQSK